MAALVLPLVTSWHMGALHPFEQALTLLLAFGPFVVLGIVLWRRSKEDEAVAEEDHASPGSSSRTAQGSDRTDLTG